MQTKTIAVQNNKNQAVQDAYSMLSTNIHLDSANPEIKTLVITSCKPNVGKTTLATSLSVTLATWGSKVLLVDADIRKPAEAKHLQGEAEFGLSDYLKGKAGLEEALCKTNVENLHYLSWGKHTANPIGLLCSEGFDSFISTVKSQYDFIIFDTPSLSSVADASLLAAKTDATLLVVKMGKTTQITLRRAKEQLEKVNANILGVVLNKVKKKEYKRYFESYNYFFDFKRFSSKKKQDSSNSLVV